MAARCQSAPQPGVRQTWLQRLGRGLRRGGGCRGVRRRVAAEERELAGLARHCVRLGPVVRLQVLDAVLHLLDPVLQVVNLVRDGRLAVLQPRERQQRVLVLGLQRRMSHCEVPRQRRRGRCRRLRRARFGTPYIGSRRSFWRMLRAVIVVVALELRGAG